MPARQQFSDQQFADGAGLKLTGMRLLELMKTQQRERPGPRRGKSGHGSQCPLEQLGGEAAVPLVERTRCAGSQRPQGTGVAVLASELLQPAVIVGHEIAEAPGLLMKRGG